MRQEQNPSWLGVLKICYKTIQPMDDIPSSVLGCLLPPPDPQPSSGWHLGPVHWFIRSQPERRQSYPNGSNSETAVGVGWRTPAPHTGEPQYLATKITPPQWTGGDALTQTSWTCTGCPRKYTRFSWGLPFSRDRGKG